MPGLHNLYAFVLTRGSQRRFPVIDLDGRRIGDSTAIIAALESRQPDPPLYPADPADRARALALEDYFDEELAPSVRSYLFHHTLGDKDAAVKAVVPARARRQARVMRAAFPVMSVIARKDYHADEASAARAAERIRACMDRLEADLHASGYLAGDRFSVADLAAAALFTPLLAPAQRPHAPRRFPAPILELHEELEERDGGAWVAEMYARHRGVSAEVQA